MSDKAKEAIEAIREEHLRRMLAFGLKYRQEGCTYCEEHKNDNMMPPHNPSIHCESGKHPHCTCDICY